MWHRNFLDPVLYFLHTFLSTMVTCMLLGMQSAIQDEQHVLGNRI